MHASTLNLGPWVETHTERCRRGRSVTVAVNRRTQTAMLLDDDPAAEGLHAELRDGGFCADQPPTVEAPTAGRFRRFLRTFDIHWRKADAVVGAIYRTVGHHAWRRGGIVAQGVLAVAGLLAVIAVLSSNRPLELRPTAWHLPAYIALSLVAVAVHELGHALVLARHGRRVASVGFRLHLGSPAFYVESVEALLLTRRQRMLQAAAGPWAEWQAISIAAIVLCAAPDTPWTPVLHRFVVLAAFTILTNLLPFAGLDGSLLFADLVREPNLAADARAALGRVGRGRRPGDGLLVAYGIANAAVSALLLLSAVGLWYLLFGHAVRELLTHGPLGVLGAAALLGVSFGPSLAGTVPHLRRLTSIDRFCFRFERRTRVRMAERFAATAPFDQLDERDLGILAGQLDLHRVRRSLPLHEPGFRGYLATDSPVEVTVDGAVRALGAGVHHIEGPGVVATVARRRGRARLGLLPRGVLPVLHLDPSRTGGPSITCRNR